MSDPLIGKKIGNYEITEQLGQGGMGAVYKAVHAEIGNIVAVKVLGLGRDVTDRDRTRFLNEAKALASLRHPNIVGVQDFVPQDGIYFTLMEYVEGRDLRSVLIDKQGPLSLSQVGRIFVQIARALDYAHNRGVVHRDIKPANIIVSDEGRATLSDFGIAKLSEATTMDLTREGAAIGTPKYMSPEQASGQAVGPQSDVYSLGIVLFEMVTGKVPFEADTPIEMIGKHVTKDPPSPRSLNENLSKKQEQVILKALEKDLDKRYQRAGDLANDFVATLTGSVEIDIPERTGWDGFVEGAAWGRVLKVWRMFRKGVGTSANVLTRSIISLVLGFLAALYILLIILANYASNSIENRILDIDWPFDEVAVGYAIEQDYTQLAGTLEAQANQSLPGAFTDFKVEPIDSEGLRLEGLAQGIKFSMELYVELQDGLPVFRLERVSGIPLPGVRTILVSGANDAFATVIEEASASIDTIEIIEDRLLVIIDGSGTEVSELVVGGCNPGVAFTDDFSDIYSGWSQQFTSREAEVGYSGGGYRLLTNAQNIVLNQAVACRFLVFDASVEAAPVGDPGDASWGMVFYQIDADNYWVFQINALGWYSLDQIIEGQHELIIPWENSDAIVTDGLNVFRVVMNEGLQGELIINDVSLGTFDASAAGENMPGSGANFGLYLRSGRQEGVEVMFDNYAVNVP